MATTATASALLDAARALDPHIKPLIEQIETDRCLPPSLVKAMTDAGLFRMMVPKKFGGLEVDMATVLRVIEDTSQMHGSVGWCTMISGLGGLICGFLSEDGAREIYGSNPDVVTGGTFFPPGQAIAEKGGYRVTGRWPFNSGCRHCDWLLGNCVVMENGTPRFLPNGLPEIRTVYFPVAEAEIIDTWSVLGMRGTGSHDVAVNNIFVPERRTALLISGPPHIRAPLYLFPLMGSIAIGIASVATGMARGAIDAFIEIARTKTLVATNRPINERSVVQMQVGQAEALLRAGRALLFETVNEVWDSIVSGEEVSVDQRARVRLAATHATTSSAQAIDLMYHAAGTSGIWTSSPLQRYFRDVHTMMQHAYVSSTLYETVGQIFLGKETNVVML